MRQSTLKILEALIEAEVEARLDDMASDPISDDLARATPNPFEVKERKVRMPKMVKYTKPPKVENPDLTQDLQELQAKHRISRDYE